MSKTKNLVGIRGWLIFIAIGVVVSPINISVGILANFAQMFSNGIWEALTTPGGEAYNEWWSSILIGESLINCVMCLISLYIAYKFFIKSRDFPKCFIGKTILILIVTVADASAVKLIYPGQSVLDGITENMRTIVVFGIWSIYLLLSKRVEATFVN